MDIVASAASESEAHDALFTAVSLFNLINNNV